MPRGHTWRACTPRRSRGPIASSSSTRCSTETARTSASSRAPSRWTLAEPSPSTPSPSRWRRSRSSRCCSSTPASRTSSPACPRTGGRGRTMSPCWSRPPSTALCPRPWRSTWMDARPSLRSPIDWVGPCARPSSAWPPGPMPGSCGASRRITSWSWACRSSAARPGVARPSASRPGASGEPPAVSPPRSPRSWPPSGALGASSQRCA